MADDGWAPWATPSRVHSTRPAVLEGLAPAERGVPTGEPPADTGPTTASENESTAGTANVGTATAGTAHADTATTDAPAAPTPATDVTTAEPRSQRDRAPAADLLETETVRRGGRAPLSRMVIVAAALRVIDADGLEALNMRRLGQELGVGAMAVYRHVKDKDQLLDLVIEGVLRDVERPELTGTWREDAARIARATREGLMRHRRAVALVASRPWVGPTGLDGIDVTLGVFRGAGLDDRLAVFAQFALGNFVQGFCAWESANLGAASDDPASRAEALSRYQSLVASLPAERFPNLVALAPTIVAGPLDARFEFGLTALLDGIEAAGDRSEAGGNRSATGVGTA